MSFLRSVKPQIDWARSTARVGDTWLPVCKFGSEFDENIVVAKSVPLPTKSKLSGTVPIFNSFADLPIEQLPSECIDESGVAPDDPVHVVERVLHD
jgi:hypothetical protein